jgi:hypothetical protein
MDGWDLERVNLDQDNPGFSESTGHFTQIEWKASTQVGCSRTQCLEFPHYFTLFPLTIGLRVGEYNENSMWMVGSLPLLSSRKCNQHPECLYQQCREADLWIVQFGRCRHFIVCVTFFASDESGDSLRPSWSAPSWRREKFYFWCR